MPRQQQQSKRRRKRYQAGSAYAGDVRPTGILALVGSSTTMKVVFAIMALALAAGGLYGVFQSGAFANNQDNPAGFVKPPDENATGTPQSGATPIAKQYSAPPAMSIDASKTYTATIKTDVGDIQVELFAGEHPQTVNNFVFLARDGFYDGLAFHYVAPSFSVQAGDPSGQGAGGPGYDLPQEGTGTFEAGTLGMANGITAGTNNGSQFFIALAPAEQFNQFTPFGRVTSGLDIAETIAKGTKIESIEITEQ